MKKIFDNFWTQLFLGLITGAIGIIVFHSLATIFYIKHAGFSLFLLESGGDKSPLTYAIATIFIIFAYIFPTFIWLWLNKFGKLKTAIKKIKIITFIFFAILPLLTYLSWGAFSKFQSVYKNYRSVRDTCIIENGVNKMIIGESTKEFECKNGVFNGFTRTYNSKGILVYEGVYLDGKLNGVENVYYDDGKINILSNYKNGEREGAEIYYNEDGSISSYLINEKGKPNWVYLQIPEKNLNSEVDLESQDFFCKNQEEYLSKNYDYSCSNGVVNSKFIKYDLKGNLSLRVEILEGMINGTYEEFAGGELYRYLEYKNGNLDGKVYKYSIDGNLEYEGQYKNGLQDGIFRRYDYKGNIESEVIFQNGEIIQINMR